MIFKLTNFEDIENFFPKNIDELKQFVEKSIDKLKNNIKNICELKPDQINFENSFGLFDQTCVDFQTICSTLQSIEMLNPNNKMQRLALELNLQVKKISTELVENNKQLFQILESASQILANDIDQDQQNLINKSLGKLDTDKQKLSDSENEFVNDLEEKISMHCQNFELNITQDPRILHISKRQLAGVDGEYLKNLRRASDQHYELYPDSEILESSLDERTRKKFWTIGANTAYPKNQKELEQIINSRDILARKSGYINFAQMDIEGQMIQTPQDVERFLNQVIKSCQKKLAQETKVLSRKLPPNIKLNSQKFKPWDFLYVKNYYKKNILKIDEDKIAQYFPANNTIDKILQLLEVFFNVKFTKQVTNKLWDNNLIILKVERQSVLMGFIVLDLFSRKNKYQYVLEQPIINSFIYNNKIIPGLTLLVANFAYKANETTLLQRCNVTSLLHELGHIMHTILGAQPIASNCGSQVVKDFVEVPSQLLEQFMFEPNSLEFLSSHYKTKKSLPARLIKKIVDLKNFDSADLILEQCYYAALSLNLFKEGINKEIFKIHEKLFKSIRTNIEFSELDHSYASFDHLISYGAKYYSYLWSKAIALDLFNHIKVNSTTEADFKKITRKYVEEIIMKGASQDPAILIKNFLGRESNLDAFLKDLCCE